MQWAFCDLIQVAFADRCVGVVVGVVHRPCLLMLANATPCCRVLAPSHQLGHSPMTYQDFLDSKSSACKPAGFDPQQFTASLFPFQRDIVTMACRVGKFCIWADCGMGKTAMQLEWAHQVHLETGGNVLVLAPLAVAHQTVREGSKFNIPCQFAATQAEVKPGITVTNYEKLAHFDAGSLQAWYWTKAASSRHTPARPATRSSSHLSRRHIVWPAQLRRHLTTTWS
jgi:hypothetical protein